MDNNKEEDQDQDQDQDIDDLDTSWLQDFDVSDKEYKDYYTEDLSFIIFHSLYINRANDMEQLKEEKLLLKTQGFIQKEELLTIIKHNSFLNGKKYGLMSILKFNLNFDPMHLKTFLKSKNPNIGSSFLHSVTNIDTIHLDKSISMFHDLNDIILLFYEKDKSSSNNHTKKMCSNTNKKTKRKQFKETTP